MPGGDLAWIWGPYKSVVPTRFSQLCQTDDTSCPVAWSHTPWSTWYMVPRRLKKVMALRMHKVTTAWTSVLLSVDLTPIPALMNLIEATLNLEYLYLRHTSPKTLRLTKGTADRPRYHAPAPLVGFASALMTLAKTSLYFLQGKFGTISRLEKMLIISDYYCGWCMTGHNSRRYFWQYYVAPNVSISCCDQWPSPADVLFPGVSSEEKHPHSTPI